MNERPGEFSSVPKTALPKLRDVIVDRYDLRELSEKVLAFDVEFASVVPPGLPYADQVVDLLGDFRRKNKLASLLSALVEGRQDDPEFALRLVQAIKDAPAPEERAPPEERKEDIDEALRPRRAWLVPVLLGGTVLALELAAFGCGRYLFPNLPGTSLSRELVIHLRRPESTILDGAYVKYKSRANKGKDLPVDPISAGEFHVSLADIVAQTGISVQPDPAGVDGAQGVIQCETDCYKIVQMEFEDPNTLFLYLEKAYSDQPGGNR
jgi:hypothetical protein